MSDYKLVFEDDFNGTELNRDIWGKEIGFMRNHEPQYYTDEDRNCYVKDGCLIIETIKEDYREAKYTSASITTANRLAFTYGRFEMKAKLPVTRAVWPAFWLLGDSIHHGVNWPKCGEIDIMELTGGWEVGDKETIATLHWESFKKGDHDESGARLVNPAPLNEDFHIYAVEWTEEGFTWYFDDKVVHTCKITDDMQGAFNKPHYIIINTALQNWDDHSCPGPETVFPQKYIIDYVRVYQKEENIKEN